MINLGLIKGWKDFERFCADLLEAEGFHIESEPGVDTTGVDIVARCEYRAHGSSLPPVHVRWLVQCKHLAISGKRLARQSVEEILVSYEAARGPNDGLLVIVSSDYTEPAMDIVQQFLRSKPDARVMIWNQRQVAALLDRHPHLIRRYDLSVGKVEPLISIPLQFSNKETAPVLLLSDQSVLAHDLFNYLRDSGLRVVFLPVWNYSDALRLDLFLTSFARVKFGLIVLFLGDSFTIPFPRPLEDFLVRAFKQGGAFLVFPFVAWSIAKGQLSRLANVIPVRLVPNPVPQLASARTRSLADRVLNLVGSLALETSFEEDEYREYDPKELQGHIRIAAAGRFGMSHSFEHLEAVPGANVVWRDTLGNPFLVTGAFGGTKVAYLNTCCHSCMNMANPTAIASPLASSNEFRDLMAGLLRWFLGRETTGNKS